jgi:ABC-type transport system involved in multi-copper enzyme maturation permease subunit
MLEATGSEFRKLWSYPLGAVFGVVGLVLPALLAWLMLGSSADGAPVTSDLATSVTLRALQFGQVSGIVLAAGLAGQEYQHHQLRTSLVAINPRWRLLASKMTVIAAAVLAQCWLSTVVAVSLIAATHGAVATQWLDWGHLAGATAEASISWLQLAWMSLGVTVICRSLIPAVAVLGAAVLGLNQLLDMLFRFAKYGPSLSTSGIFLPGNNPHYLTPASGLLVQTTWMACALIAATLIHARRDVR